MTGRVQGKVALITGAARGVSEAVLWLASDEARYVQGVVLPVDAGQLAK
jgi:NAD(P)-dependent dehydrogenase (short-subunit alcohol dehydrogenase family)